MRLTRIHSVRDNVNCVKTERTMADNSYIYNYDFQKKNLKSKSFYYIFNQ